MPKILFASTDSANRISGVPRVPNSPLVKSTIPTFFPCAMAAAMVPATANSASSGCAAKTSMSSFMMLMYAKASSCSNGRRHFQSV